MKGRHKLGTTLEWDRQGAIQERIEPRTTEMMSPCAIFARIRLNVMLNDVRVYEKDVTATLDPTHPDVKSWVDLLDRQLIDRSIWFSRYRIEVELHWNTLRNPP